MNLSLTAACNGCASIDTCSIFKVRQEFQQLVKNLPMQMPPELKESMVKMIDEQIESLEKLRGILKIGVQLQKESEQIEALEEKLRQN